MEIAKKRRRSSWIYEIVIFAMLGTLMFCSKIIMEAIPNVHLLGMFTIVYTLLTLHSLVLYGLAIVGGIILIVAAAKRKFTFESGLIPPVEKGKFSAFFLNAGVAASIAYFAFRFIYSLV